MPLPMNGPDMKAFSIQGRLYQERVRSMMSNEERKWRQQWVRDQVLDKCEPRPTTYEYYKERHNIIKRAVWWPMDTLFKPVKMILGQERGHNIRYAIGHMTHYIVLAYMITYYFKYNTNDWTRKGGWRVRTPKPTLVPGDPGYPFVSDKKEPADYDYRGFKNSPI